MRELKQSEVQAVSGGLFFGLFSRRSYGYSSCRSYSRSYSSSYGCRTNTYSRPTYRTRSWC